MANLWHFDPADSVRIFHGFNHGSALHAKFLILALVSEVRKRTATVGCDCNEYLCGRLAQLRFHCVG
jgi:hypothetical protein